MDARAEVDRLLHEHGAILKRNNGHQVWELPNGKKFVCASTPSDFRAGLNSLSDLRKVLGIQDETRGLPGERREKHSKPGRQGKESLAASGLSAGLTIAEALSISGVAEESLRDRLNKVEKRNARQRAANAEITQELADLRNQIKSCWMCRLRAWWDGKRRAQ